MRNKKTWLVIKGVIILLFTAFILWVPTDDLSRKVLRFIMLSLFVFSFIIDLNRLRKNKK